MADSKQQAEEQKFKEAFVETLAVIDRIGPFCASVEEMREMIQLAIDNDAQLRLLCTVMTAKR